MRRTFPLLPCAVSLLLSTQRLPAPVPEGSPPSKAHSKTDSVAAKHETGNSSDSSPTITPAGRASITNHGVSSVPTTGTPLGRYQKMVYDAIGSKWYAYMADKANLVTVGTARISFWIDQNGRVKDPKVVQISSNEAFANICLQSILDIKLPPIPEDVASVLPPKGLEEEIAFTTFSKR